MEARVFPLTCTALPLSPASSSSSHGRLWPSPFKPEHAPKTVLRKSMNKEEPLLEGLPKEYYDDEWQARQREKTKELHQRRQEEDEEEERKVEDFIRAAEEVEEKIEEAAEKGELTELVLMVIWNRLDLARRDEEKDVIRSLDLLYRRVEAEILKREATPAMRLLNDLLNMHDGYDGEGWLKECKKRMVDTFPREDPFSILVPEGFDIDKHQGPLQLPLEADDVLLRVDFVREVDALLQEVRAEQNEVQNAQGLMLSPLQVG
ncbi:protein PALE CRESS chloroplastic [Prunus yedoensis var. nudiflora]|uniref:Protein PALE CRESS chloroplastic n=1 Tax=Prunus yedoensis var. nudiflora TaxID=2094558 RepID=A0A314ZE80_PRUYE|nr:protein PALE CRESS chloroplastic [Prunus yedoensis var. nudiflora]